DGDDGGGGKPIQRGLINPEGDQSAFGDETAEVMGSNGAMIVPQDIKPKQTVRQDFRQCLIIAPRSSTCRVQLHWRLSRSLPHGARRGGLGQVNSAGRDVAEYNLERKHTSSRLRLACRSGILATRHGRARPGHACLWTDILNPLGRWPAMPKKAKSKAKSKAKLNIKKSQKGRRAAPPKRRRVAVSIPALEAAATKAADFAAKHEAAAAESKGAAEQ